MGFSVHGILQARILEWVAISLSRGSSQPRDWTQVSHTAGRRFNLWATREALYMHAAAAAAAAESLQSCPTLCDPIDGSPPGSPIPGYSPGKNTGVGCHFLLQCMKVKSESEVAQSYPTLRDPMDCSLPGSSVHGIFQARVLEWVAISFTKGSSWPGDETQVFCIVGRRFTLWATREALIVTTKQKLLVYTQKIRYRNQSISLIKSSIHK